jgi:nucleoid-associated protein EbfC
MMPCGPGGLRLGDGRRSGARPARGDTQTRREGAMTIADGGNVDPGGQLDMQQLLAAAQQMQEQLLNAQEELADAEVEGTSGGGLVKAIVNGQGELVELTISAAAIDPASAEETAQTVADLVLAAVRDANRAASELQQEMMGPFAAGFGGAPGGGTGMPGLPGFPGMPDLPGLAGPDTGPASGPAGGH